MKTTINKPTTTTTTAPPSVAQRRDELLALSCMRSALQGLLACNSFYDSDGIRFRDGLGPEELTIKAEAIGLELFDRFKRWRKEERHIQRLKQNQKVSIQ